MVTFSFLKGFTTRIHFPTARCLSTGPGYKKTFWSKDLKIESLDKKEMKPKPTTMSFGQDFTDYMLEVDWTTKKGWGRPVLKKTQEILLHPAIKGLHYGIQLFEGLKAFRGSDNKIRLFRPELNMERMNRSAARGGMPGFDGKELVNLISEHIRLEKDWVPKQDGASLYIRPFIFATDPRLGIHATASARLMVLLSPVATYFSDTSAGLRLLADSRYVRAWTGGVGAFKLGSNYGPTIFVAEVAHKKGCHQVLWLSGEEKLVTEVGAMNFGMIWINEQGEKELITPALHKGLVLPGVTRQSVVELTRSWGEFKVSEKDFTLDQMVTGMRDGRVHEIFGCGTAAVVVPVTGIVTVDEKGQEESHNMPSIDPQKSIVARIYREITDIQYGRKEMKDWTRVIA